MVPVTFKLSGHWKVRPYRKMKCEFGFGFSDVRLVSYPNAIQRNNHISIKVTLFLEFHCDFTRLVMHRNDD